MNIPCPNKIDCGCDDNPLTNFSSETPDERVYRALSWLQVQARLGRRPRIGGGRPPVICSDPTSPLYARLCADRISIITTNLENDAWVGTGNPPPVFFSQQATCEVSCADGGVFTYQVAPGAFAGQDQVTVDGQALALACSLAAGRQICLGDLTLFGCVDDTYDAFLVASTTAPVASMVVSSGALPPGLGLVRWNARTFRLVGLPTTPANYTFTILATNALGNYIERTYTISIVGISPDTLPDGEVGTAYNEGFTASGGTAPYTFTVVAGALPDGLTIDAFGTITGTPTTEEDASFTVEVADSSTTPIQCRKAYTLHIAPAVTNLKAWWPFEDLVVPPYIDVVDSMALVALSGSGGFRSLTVPAKVGTTAMLLRSTIAATTCHVTTSPSSTDTILGSDGFTMTGWFRTSGGGAGDSGGPRLFLHNGVWVNGGVGNPVALFRPYATWEQNTGAFTINARDAANNPLFTDFSVAVASPATWNFFVLIYSLSTGRMYFSLNNGGLNQSPDAYVFALPYTTGRIQCENVNNSGNIFNTSYDELNYWDKVLNATEISNLWNGGAGRTYP